MINFNEICKVLKQKVPFVLVDKVLELDYGKRIVAIKNITGSEAFSEYHFPNNPIYPGVLIIECVAQTSALLFSLSQEQEKEQNGYLVLGGVQRFSFMNIVRPGDTLRIEVNIIKIIDNMALIKAAVRVGDTTVAEGQLSFGVAKDE